MGIGRHGGGRDGRHAADTGTSGGRTGICIEVIRVEEDYGLVDVWYE